MIPATLTEVPLTVFCGSPSEVLMPVINAGGAPTYEGNYGKDGKFFIFVNEDNGEYYVILKLDSQTLCGVTQGHDLKKLASPPEKHKEAHQ